MATQKYTKFPDNRVIKEYIERGGAGTVGAHTVVDDANPFVGSAENYAYAIVAFTDGAIFTVLQENGQSVDAVRLDAGGAGYPANTVIPGKFTRITAAAGAIFGVFLINYQEI